MQHVWFFSTRHKRLRLTHVTQFSESLTIISFSWTFFHRNWLLPQVLDTKNFKYWGPTMSFRASKSGFGYEVQKKMEAVRLQNLYPCNIYRTDTRSLSISFITVQTEKTMLSLHVFRFNKCHHCLCPAWGSVLYHAYYSFLLQAACFLIKFIWRLREIVLLLIRKQIWKFRFKSVCVYLLEGAQRMVEFSF